MKLLYMKKIKSRILDRISTKLTLTSKQQSNTLYGLKKVDIYMFMNDLNIYK